ncbi:hypothetical protein J437_LFUL016056, partial [Ladona fulva]
LFKVENCEEDDWRCSSCNRKKERSTTEEKDALIQRLKKELEEKRERVKRLMSENEDLKKQSSTRKCSPRRRTSFEKDNLRGNHSEK